MLRGKPLVGSVFRTSVVVAGWFFAVVLPPMVGGVFTPLVGTMLGGVALQEPEPTRTQGALIVATSLLSFVMWGLIRSGAPGRGLFLGS
jgi:hypothetical protein